MTEPAKLSAGLWSDNRGLEGHPRSLRSLKVHLEALARLQFSDGADCFRRAGRAVMVH